MWIRETWELWVSLMANVNIVLCMHPIVKTLRGLWDYISCIHTNRYPTWWFQLNHWTVDFTSLGSSVNVHRGILIYFIVGMRSISLTVASECSLKHNRTTYILHQQCGCRLLYEASTRPYKIRNCYNYFLLTAFKVPPVYHPFLCTQKVSTL